MIRQLFITFVLSIILGGCPSEDLKPSFIRQGKRGAQENDAGSGKYVEVTYIANEGVLISSGDDQVLIDALHKPYGPAYLPTSPAIEAKMMRAEKPFDSIDFFLVSHVHGDHFDAQTVLRYLDKQQKVVLFSSSQVIDSVLTYAGPETRLDESIKTVPHSYGTSKTIEKHGIVVTAGKITHSSEQFRWVENLGHVVEVGRLTFLHVGDPAFGRADTEQLLANQKNIDVAILPAWFLTDAKGRAVIDEVIQPKELIFVHVSPSETRRIKNVAKRHYPHARVFTEPMEMVRYE